MQQCVLDRHISRVHAEMVKCPECDKSVSQPRLDAHMATHVAKSVTCNECSFEAASSHSLEQVWQNYDKIMTKSWQNYDKIMTKLWHDWVHK